MADKFYVPSDYGFIDCDKVKVTGYDFPDVVFGNEWHGWITFEEDEDEATYVDVDPCPGWISYELSAGRVDFTGVPDKKEYIGDVELNISLSNCMENDPSGEGHDSVVGQFEVLCVPAAVTGSSFPTATWMVAWSGWVTFEGTDPLNLAVTSCPSWASYTIGEDRIDFSGTPDIPGTATFTYTYQNCGYDTETATNSVTVECTNVAVASSSFPDVEFGKAWTGYVTFSGTTPYTLAVTSCPSWVSYTIGTARIDFSGTPSSNSVIGTNTIKYTYANCARSATTGTASFAVTCTAASIISTSNVDTEIDYGSSWTATITWNPGSSDVECSVTMSERLSLWATWSVSGNTVTISGTADNVDAVNYTSHFTVTLTSCGSSKSYQYSIKVNPTYYMQTYTSSGTFTVPAGIHWLRACMLSGPNGAIGLRFDGLSKNFLGLTQDTMSVLSDASGGVSSFGGVSGPKIVMGYYVSDYSDNTIVSATDYCDCEVYYPKPDSDGICWYGMHYYFDSSYWYRTQDGHIYQNASSEYDCCEYHTYKGISLECTNYVCGSQSFFGSTASGVVSGFADYYGDVHYTSARSGTANTTTTCPTVTVEGYCDADWTAFDFCHTLGSAYRLAYLEVTPGATYSYTVGSAGKASYWKDGAAKSGSTLSDGTGTGTLGSGSGSGAIMLEWGSVIENAGPSSSYTATPTASYSVPASLASVPDVPNMYDDSRAPAGDIAPLSAPEALPPDVMQRLPDDENTES